MAKKKAGLGPLKRYGVRYGKTNKERSAKIEVEQRKPQPCPSCLKPSARRLAVGIYQCRKCNTKFTGRAYSVTQELARAAPITKPAEELEIATVEEELAEETVEDELAKETPEETESTELEPAPAS